MIAEQFKNALGQEIFNDIIGQNDVKHQLLGALATGHHVLIIGPPGVGKTTLAKNIARVLPEISTTGCEFNCTTERAVCPECLASKKSKACKKVAGKDRFVRVQGSPDLTSEDLFGDIDPVKALKYGATSIEAFTPGKIFRANNGILFFDEINRCPEKLQNALLQALEERKVTLGGYVIDFPAEFLLIGTMNPDDRSTEPLSDVFLDRFDAAYMSYPEDAQTEKQIVSAKGDKLAEFPEELLDFSIEFVRKLRESKYVAKKPSVRAQLSLYERAQANAIAEKRQEVIFEDIERAANSVLSHRIELVASLKFVKPAQEFVKDEFMQYSEQYSELKSKLGDYG